MTVWKLYAKVPRIAQKNGEVGSSEAELLKVLGHDLAPAAVARKSISQGKRKFDHELFGVLKIQDS